MTVLKLVLFAADEPGLAVARLIRERGDRVSLLVLDRDDFRGRNDAIREAIGDAADDIRYHDEIGPVDADLGILAWWPHIVKKDLLEAARVGFLNFHPSLLPYNRGKHYNFWALVEGAPFGVSIHWVNERIDGGDIAFQAPLEVTWADTGESLFHRARKAIVDLFAASYDRIRTGDIPRIPQNLDAGSFHKASELDPASRIDLDAPIRARDLLNLLRARTFPPHPGAWFVDDGQRWEVRVEIGRGPRSSSGGAVAEEPRSSEELRGTAKP